MNGNGGASEALRHVWDTLVGLLFGASGATILNWFLRRRSERADIVAKQQAVIQSLWDRIEELQLRVDELESRVRELTSEIDRLQRLLRAYERKFGRRFRIGTEGQIVELRQEDDRT